MDYYPDTPGLGWHVWLGVTITIVPATLLVGLRFYARVACKVGLKIDDWLIVAALFFAWIMAVIRYIELLRFGLGHHKDELPDSIVVTFQKVFLISSIRAPLALLIETDIPGSASSVLRLRNVDAIIVTAAIQAHLRHIKKVQNHHLRGPGIDHRLVHLLLAYGRVWRTSISSPSYKSGRQANVYPLISVYAGGFLLG